MILLTTITISILYFSRQLLFDHIQIYTNIVNQTKGMISQQGDYYVCTDDAQPPKQADEVRQPEEKEIEAKGDIKERLKMIQDRVQIIKQQKKKYANQRKVQALSDIYCEPELQPGDFSLSLQIPAYILEIEERVSRLQQKVTGYEVYRQKSEKKGTVMERIKALQKKLEDMLKAKSIETITNSIIQYSINIDQREEYMKQLFLYQVYTKTQGLTDELDVLQKYLQNLGKVQRVVNSAVPTAKLIKDHNEILQRSQKSRQRIQKLFASMKGQYQKLLQEIDGIDV